MFFFLSVCIWKVYIVVALCLQLEVYSCIVTPSNILLVYALFHYLLYRYRKFKLGNDIELICRCEHDAVLMGPNGELQFINIKTLNEWDSRVSESFLLHKELYFYALEKEEMRGILCWTCLQLIPYLHLLNCKRSSSMLSLGQGGGLTMCVGTWAVFIFCTFCLVVQVCTLNHDQ